MRHTLPVAGRGCRSVRSVETSGRLSLTPTALVREAGQRPLGALPAADAPPDGDDPILRLIAKVERLEGEEFLMAIDGLMGATPAGRGTVLRLNMSSMPRRHIRTATGSHD